MRRWMGCALFAGALGLGLMGLGLPGAPSAEAATPGEIVGALPLSGTGTVRWGGGGMDLLLPVLTARGCSPRMIWAPASTEPGDGALVGYVVGAPPFVNAAFLARYPAGPWAETTLVVDCVDGGAPPLVPILVVARTRAATWAGSQGYWTLCIRYAVAGGTGDTCQTVAGPPFATDTQEARDYFRAAACFESALIARPLPECWPRLN